MARKRIPPESETRPAPRLFDIFYIEIFYFNFFRIFSGSRLVVAHGKVVSEILNKILRCFPDSMRRKVPTQGLVFMLIADIA